MYEKLHELREARFDADAEVRAQIYKLLQTESDLEKLHDYEIRQIVNELMKTPFTQNTEEKIKNLLMKTYQKKMKKRTYNLQ